MLENLGILLADLLYLIGFLVFCWGAYKFVEFVINIVFPTSSNRWW